MAVPQTNHSHFFNGIPYPDPDCTQSVKAFVIDLPLVGALLPRLMQDQAEKRGGIVNGLEGPDGDALLVQIPFENTLQMIQNELSQRREDPVTLGKESSFILGALDIVTYPFYHALIYKMDLNAQNYSRLLWEINSNLLLYYYPDIRNSAGAITIFHFNEDPLEDAPTHNFIFFGRQNSSKIRHIIQQLYTSSLRPIAVSNRQPYFDDRYIYRTRRPEDGEPFNLREFQRRLLST